MSFTKLDYCQYLLSSQINYTITNLADHLKKWSHDTINRYLKGEKLTPRLLFEQVLPLLEPDPQAYLIFDDTVLDKRFGAKIELTRKHNGAATRSAPYSGHRGGLLRLRQPQNQTILGHRLPDLETQRPMAKRSSITSRRC
jgi:hypothetical protein